MIVTETAIFSDDRSYRYWLKRPVYNERFITNPDGGRCLFIMLNPSKADEWIYDNTVTRCKDFAIRWGYGTLIVVNIFALVSTDPKELYKCRDPIGSANDRYILDEAKKADLRIAAWGNHGAIDERGDRVLRMLWNQDLSIHSLGMTGKGQPKHPLRLSKTLRPQPLYPPLQATHRAPGRI